MVANSSDVISEKKINMKAAETVEEKIARASELVGRRAAVLEEVATIDKELEYIFGGSRPVVEKKQKTARGTPLQNSNKQRKPDEDAKRNDRIFQWLEKGKEPSWVAAKCGVAVQTVYNVRSRMKKTTGGGPVGGKQGIRCEECKTTGSRHFKTCSKAKGTSGDLSDFSSAGKEHVPQPRVAIGPDRYAMIHEAMHDKEFQSARYALINKLSPAEVNAAVRSKDYSEYLDIRTI